jgi:apolipoprotein N-acyltransferase
MLSFGIFGVIIHSILMSLLSFAKIALPLHPLILIYPNYYKYLPTFNYPFINLFLIFVIVSLLFCKSNWYSKCFFILLILSLSSFFKNVSASENQNIKIAIIQVGLYYEKGGNTSDFFKDLQSFLKRNPGVSVVIFSENNLYSYKSRYNEELTENLLSNVLDSKLNEQYHLFLSFGGFRDINNIVTYYHHDDIIQINQKKVLIPFVEKNDFLNRKVPMYSEYYYLHDHIKNMNIRLSDYSVTTKICYDALFPELLSTNSDIVMIQSNYKLLDKGHGHDKLKKYATYLSKFINGINSRFIINVQNYGGTVVLSNNWSIDHETFESSKSEPFSIVNLSEKILVTN